MKSINPATGETLEDYEWMSNQEAERKIARADDAFRVWRDTAFSERSQLLGRVARLLRERVRTYSKVITAEMGKPITESKAEIEKCAFACEFYAENAEPLLTEEPMASDTPNSSVVFEPLGIILAIMPWNFPFWQVFRHAAPALMTGNVILVKHAPNVPGCARRIEQVFRDAGFPEGVVSSVMVDVPQVEGLIADQRVRAVTLTGSDRAGSQVAALAGKYLKKSVMELGGSDPFVVLEDADLEKAVETAVKARYQNSGQSCIAAKRFIVAEKVADDFERRFVDAVEKLVMGDPVDPGTQIGPIARHDLLENLERQVDESVTAGARVVTGGAGSDGKGLYYQPTVLTEVTRDMPVWREETFGPVAAVMRVKDDDEAVEAANDSEYGLGGNVWTSDVERGRAIARRMNTGGVFINGMTHSDPRLPFGGIKRSGYGRELSVFGIREFVNIKTIWRP